jgi:hypothetical protein
MQEIITIKTEIVIENEFDIIKIHFMTINSINLIELYFKRTNLIFNDV